MNTSVLLSLIVCVITYTVATSASWEAVSGTSATTLVGLGASATSEYVLAAAAANGVGGEPLVYDGTNWKFYRANGALLLDAAINGNGLGVIVSTASILISTDYGQTFNSSSSLKAISQNVRIVEDTIYLVGTTYQYPSVVGVAKSTDAGATWTTHNVGEMVRYGSYPSANVWYVSAGMWSSDVSLAESSGINGITKNILMEKKISSKQTLTEYGVTFSHKSNDNVKKAAAASTDDSTATGWFGAIYKTIDGGETFTAVFQSNLDTDYYYFNEIDCISETHCVAVAEGSDSEGNDLILAYTTFDGGDNWTLALSENQPSLMSVKMVDEDTVWLGGAAINNHMIGGGFWLSTDGGNTFTLSQVLPSFIVTDIDFNVNTGFAAGCAPSGVSCSIASLV